VRRDRWCALSPLDQLASGRSHTLGVAYGEPLSFNRETDGTTACAELAAAIERSLRALHEEVATMTDAAA